MVCGVCGVWGVHVCVVCVCVCLLGVVGKAVGSSISEKRKRQNIKGEVKVRKD